MILVHLLFAASWIPQQAPVVKPERVLAIYDVIDLVGESAEGGQWPFDPDALEPALPVAPKRHALTVLGEAVCAHIQPALEPGLDEVQQTGDGSLVVLARPEQQAWVQAFLERQRAVTDELVDVQVRTLEGPRGSVAKWLEMGDATTALVREDRIEALLERAGSIGAPTGELTLLSAPRILLFNRAPGYITVQNEFSYVSEYQRRVVQPGDRELIDPVVEVIKEGDFVALTPVCVGEQLYSLDLSVQRVEVVQPIPTRTVRLGGEDLEIAEPEVLSVTVESKLVLEDGATMALLAACPAPEGERSNRELVVLVHLDVVAPEGK